MELLRIGALAERSGASIATLKFYLREGLISPVRKTGRTMSWYSPATVSRIRAIKELQRQFLPLGLIREALEHDDHASDDLAAAEAIAKVLDQHRGARSRTREEVLEGGATVAELEWLQRLGLATPGKDGRYRADDLALLSTLGAARKVGLAAEMLPFAILGDYVVALRALVEVELRLFRAGVIGRADRADVRPLTAAATTLSERLVVLLRRKLLLPTLHQMIEEDRHATAPTPPVPRGGMRQQRSVKPRRRS